MTSVNRLTIKLLSDTTVGRGEGTAGAVDTEVEHDECGLPCINGKSILGLLRDSWLSMASAFDEGLKESAIKLFGPPGDTNDTAVLRIGNAIVDQATRDWAYYAVNREHHAIHKSTILEAFTDIRHQTSENRESGAPEPTTLRQSRVVIRGLTLEAPLVWSGTPDSKVIRCLALSALGLRHIGLSRNRGRGHVSLCLNGDLDFTCKYAKGETL